MHKLQLFFMPFHVHVHRRERSEIELEETKLTFKIDFCKTKQISSTNLGHFGISNN